MILVSLILLKQIKLLRKTFLLFGMNKLENLIKILSLSSLILIYILISINICINNKMFLNIWLMRKTNLVLRLVKRLLIMLLLLLNKFKIGLMNTKKHIRLIFVKIFLVFLKLWAGNLIKVVK